jgi:hypothetical protein
MATLVSPACLLLAVTLAAQGEATSSTPAWKWQPRDASIAVEEAATVPRGSKDRASVRIHGQIASGWNYAITPQASIEAGKLYRLSAWVRVDRLGAGTPRPFFKCEFVPSQPGKTLGQVQTETYEGPLGEWRQLAGEFLVPEGTKACWLALEKGTSAAAEIDALMSDVRLEPIPRLTVLDRYRLAPLPAPLEKLRGVHPRIYLNATRITELRAAINGSHAELWKQVRQQADQAVRRGPPAYREQGDASGDEQLWQREVGNAMPVLAMAYVLSGDRQYLASARQWALASCEYKTWGLGRIDGMDLAAGHQLFGLAIIYDWCYRDLDEEARSAIRKTLARRAGAMFEAAATGKVWWQRSYLQNHLWVNITGMAAAGLALFDEVDEGAYWIGLPLEKYRRTMAALGPDGASHEGVGYWEYGVEYMLKFMDPARTLLDVDLYDHPWWRNTAAYALYLSLPRNAWRPGNCLVDLADCPRGHWYGPEYLLAGLARQYRDGHAQWLAEQVRRSGVTAPSASWLNLVWHDETLPAMPPATLPTLRHFDDMGIVSARSDWSGDESLVVFKCGPFIGHKGVAEFSYDPGGGHVHPDANHFVLFGGQWLIRDDGYFPKWTRQHNTLLVNGRGQLGEGAQWFRGEEALQRKANPRVLVATSTPRFDHVAGDAAAAYPVERGLKRFVRHLIFLKPDVLIVADDIETEKDADLELRFHTEEPLIRDGAALVARGKQATLRIVPLSPDGTRIDLERTELAGDHGRKDASLPGVRLSLRGARWRNAVAFSWATGQSPPPTATWRADGQRWSFSARGCTATLDWSTGKVQ